MDAPTSKQADLLTRSKDFCILPWIHMHVSANGRVQPCCHSRPDMPLGSLRTSTLSQVWNSPDMRELRLNMLAGRTSPQCINCHLMEESGVRSARENLTDAWRHKI